MTDNDLRNKIDRVLEMLLREGGPVKQLVALVTHLNDRLTLRILKLAEQQMESDGFGGPPIQNGAGPKTGGRIPF